MERQNVLEKEWVQMLTSMDDGTVLTALHQIRNSGSVRILPYVIDLLKNELKEKLAEHILQFIAEIKTQDAVPVMIESLNDLEKTPYFARYLSACWQSGLDFSTHIIRFTEIFVRSDYETCLEAFTLIEESLYNATEDARIKCLQHVKNANSKIEQEKYPLYQELIRIIQEV